MGTVDGAVHVDERLRGDEVSALAAMSGAGKPQRVRSEVGTAKSQFDRIAPR